MQEEAAEMELALREREEALNALQAEIQVAREQLLSFQWARFIEELRGKATRSTWMATSLLHPDGSSFDPFAIEFTGSPDPYTSLKNALEEMRSHQTEANGFPERFFELGLAHIDSQREALTCEVPDLKLLKERYGEELAGAARKSKGLEAYEAVLDIRDSYRETAISMLETCEGKIDKVMSELELGAVLGQSDVRYRTQFSSPEAVPPFGLETPPQ